MKKIIIIVSLFFLSNYFVYSQTPSQTTVANEFYLINGTIDSTGPLSFSADIILTSDTVSGHFEEDYQEAKYKLLGHNFYYSLGKVEYMQDDSFAITVYNEQKNMYVNKLFIKTADIIPLKQFTDSSLDYYFRNYSVSMIDNNGKRNIQFTALVSDVYYQSISIAYGIIDHRLSSIQMIFKEAASGDDLPNDTAVTITPLPELTKKLVMNFKDYSTAVPTGFFDYSRFIYYDRARREYSADGKYKGYKVIAVGLPNTANEYHDIEVPAAPEEPAQ